MTKGLHHMLNDSIRYKRSFITQYYIRQFPPGSYTGARAIIEFAKNVVYSVIRNRGFPQRSEAYYERASGFSRADLLVESRESGYPENTPPGVSGRPAGAAHRYIAGES